MATKKQILKLVRQNCAECMGGPPASENVWPIPNLTDVENCSAKECAFYVYRFGKDPVKNPGRVRAGRG
jgi:hypothetical protein